MISRDPAASPGTHPAQPHTVLRAYILTGLLFLLGPGTFLGLWNLFELSSRQSVSLVSAAWLQAHGHAQVFGWVGTFILGIGFYSLPRRQAAATRAAWVVWALWTVGVAMRWAANVYEWEWRVLLPASAALELVGFAIFLSFASRHQPADGSSQPLDAWIVVVLTASLGLGLTLVLNLGICCAVAIQAGSPEWPHGLDQRFLALASWGTLAPFVWGFSLRWVPVLLGLGPSLPRFVAAALISNILGVAAALVGWMEWAVLGFVAASVLMTVALGIFGRAVRPAKVRGVHHSFPAFVRVAYGWLVVAALIGVAAARWDSSGGLWGASRHAFTVGFVSVMVFCIGQRVLPEFAALRPLWSPRLMLVSLAALVAGCTIRVASEIVAYQHYGDWAWRLLPTSAVIEMAAVTCFALNLGVTIGLAPALPAPERA